VILTGVLSLWIAALMAAWCAVVSFTGVHLGRADLIASGRRAVYVACGALLLAITGLWSALLTHDLSLAYVAAHTTGNLPALYVISALWSGPAGAMLLWAAILAAYLTVAMIADRGSSHADMPWVAGSVATLIAVCVLAVALRFNPYDRLDFIPTDGQGMAPALQTPGMAVYPPLMALAYLAAAIPCALAVTALATRRLDPGWLHRAHPWVLLSWALLTAGIVLGMYRVYAEPASHGAWARDPVGSGSLLPWLGLTGILISCGVGERRGTVRRSTVTLVVVTFLLSMHGLGAARDSWGAAARTLVASETGTWAAIAAMLATGATIYLVSTRLPRDADTESAGRAGQSLPARPRGWTTSAWVLSGAGIMLFAGGLAGSAFRAEHTVTLSTGEEFRVADPLGHQWRFVSQGASSYTSLNRKVLSAVTLETWRDGKPRGLVTTERRQYVDDLERPLFEPTTAAGIRHLPLLDAYVVLDGARDDLARLSIAFNPLMSWVWIGGLLMVMGGVLRGWPATGHVGQ
jgi:cytochrome c-type biogenesis protein CcmF